MSETEAKPDPAPGDAPSPSEPERPQPAPPPADEASEPQAEADAAVVFCPKCGEEMEAEQRFCTQCGWDAESPEAEPPSFQTQPIVSPRDLGPPSNKSRMTALLLCALLGWLGAHRFYVGRTRSGILWLLTIGFLGVGVIYDLVMLATGELTDAEGKRILYWQ